MKVLIAEDDRQISNSLKKNFEEEGYSAVITNDGEQALSYLLKNQCDVLLLDWRMPKVSGIEVCKKIRESGRDLPIILLTALSEVKNKVEALNLGADDYITKPFSFEEVLARVQAVLRRYEASKELAVFAEFTLNLSTRSLETPSQSFKLTDKEFDLLRYFLNHKGTIISKEQLSKDVWELPFSPTTNVIEATIKNLRKKLEEAASKKFIKTIYGEGYFFTID